MIKKLLLGIIIIVFIFALYLFFPVNIPVGEKYIKFENKLFVEGTDYFQRYTLIKINDKVVKPQLVILNGNMPEKTLTSGFFSVEHPTFCLEGTIRQDICAFDEIYNENARIIDVKSWVIVKPYSYLTLFDYFIPFQKKYDPSSGNYKIIDCNL